MRDVLRWFDSLGKIVAGLTGALALVTSGVGLYFLLRPPPSNVEEASFTARKLQQFGPPTSLDSFVKLAGDPALAARYSEQELQAAGVYYTVPVTLVGLRGTSTNLLWSLYRAADKAPVEEWINQTAGSLRAPRDRYTVLVRVWIQLPQTSGRYIAVIELRRGNQTLDSVSTPPFLGLVGRPAPPAPTTTSTTPAPTPTTTSTEPIPTETTTHTVTAPTVVLLRPRVLIATTQSGR